MIMGIIRRRFWRRCGRRGIVGIGGCMCCFSRIGYTRTRDLMAEFAGAFKDADTVEVLDIYAASEEPIPGVDAEALVKAIRGKGEGGWSMRRRWRRVLRGWCGRRGRGM